MKTDFSTELFRDECRPTLNGPDVMARGRVLHEKSTNMTEKWGVMFGDSIISINIIDRIQIDDDVKINAENYCKY